VELVRPRQGRLGRPPAQLADGVGERAGQPIPRDPRLLLTKDSLVTGGFVLACLVSVLFGKPLLFLAGLLTYTLSVARRTRAAAVARRAAATARVQSRRG
jgi:hypothetical protein